MVCTNPMQANYVMVGGKKRIKFSNAASRAFQSGFSRVGDVLMLPCGQCIDCRLAKSREWAMRCVHEASLYDDNCFLTLTYDAEHVPVDFSLDHSHFQLFMKKLRQHVIPAHLKLRGMSAQRKVWVREHPLRYFMCGEYGDENKRPHFHVCLFNYDFKDKLFYKRENDNDLYVSETLQKLWGMGFCTIGNLTFDSAAYVARYCTKKVTGQSAEWYYQNRKPEYAEMSVKPGIGYGYYKKWKSDWLHSDFLIVNNVKCKPPRYYDKKFFEEDPVAFEKVKAARVARAEDFADDHTYDRLRVKAECQAQRFKKLIRKMEKESYAEL